MSDCLHFFSTRNPSGPPAEAADWASIALETASSVMSTSTRVSVTGSAASSVFTGGCKETIDIRDCIYWISDSENIAEYGI